MKELFVVEKTDNFGEFQPVSGAAFTHKKEAQQFIQYNGIFYLGKQIKLRVMTYVRARHDA